MMAHTDSISAPARIRRIILKAVIITVISISQAYAQQNRIDSLEALLPQKQGEERLDALKTLADLTLNMPQEKHYVKMYLEEARRQKNIEAEGYALSTLTAIYYMQFDSDSIFIFGEEAVSFNRKYKLYDDMFSAMYNIIRRYQWEGQMLTALRRAEDAYAEAKELQDNISMALMLSVMGNIFYGMEQYEEAIPYWTESIRLFEHDLPTRLPIIFGTYNFLAYMGRYMNQHQETLRYADSMQVVTDRIYAANPAYNIHTHRFRTEYHRAIAYAEVQQPAQSLEAIRRAEEIYEPQWKEVHPFSAVQLDAMYGAYCHATGDYNNALAHYDRLLQYYENERTETGIYFTKKYIARAYAAKGDYKSANEITNQILQRKEELNKERFYAQTNELRTLYELDKAELEAACRLETIHRQRLYLVGASLACLALAVIVALVARNRRRIAEKNRGLFLRIKEQDAILEELEAERRKNLVYVPAEQVEASENDPKEEMFHRLTLVMNECQLYINSEIRRKDIASITGTSENDLNDCIRSQTGMSFIDYINHLRLEHARRLLFSGISEKLTIEAIAMSSGFKIRETFHRLFREKYRLTPSEYAKIAKQQSGG